MTEGLTCCGISKAPGKPFTDHYLAVHGEEGDLDPAATYARLPASDLDSARLLGVMYGEGGQRIMHGLQSDTWYAWDGTVYAPQEKGFGAVVAEWYAMAYGRVLGEIREHYRREQRDAGTAEDEVSAEAAKAMKEHGWGGHLAYGGTIRSEKGQAGLIRQLGRTLGVDESLLDAYPGQIVVDNGVLDIWQILRDGRVVLAPHSPERLVTRRMGRGVSYDEKAASPVFDAFMTTSVAVPEQRWWLLWRTSSALFGRMSRKGFLNLIGPTDSGKSTFLETVARLGGDHATTVPIETFLSKRAGDSGFQKADLRGTRFVYASEPEPGGRYDTGLMKVITGRDRQKTAGKWEKSIDWTPQLTAVIASNGPIRFATSDAAMMERQEVIRFACGYLAKDPALQEKLDAEQPGILRHLIAALLWEARNGVPELPASMAEERERMADETEDALAFVSEWVEDGYLAEMPGMAAYGCVGVDWLYQHYRSWAVKTERVKNPLRRKDFTAVVGRRYPKQVSNGAHFIGLIWTGAPVPVAGIQNRI